MTCVILLDRYVGLYGDDNYAVTASGTLAECQAIVRHDGTTFALLKSNYTPGASWPTVLDDPQGNPDPGQILELN